MDINDYLKEENIKDKLEIGENYILEKIVNGEELKKNINTIEIGIPLLSKISFYLNNYNSTDKHNIHYNLKQNISKTLSFKQQELHEVKDLSGPIKINYYYNRKLNKKIICLADDHDGTRYSCDEGIITLENYLDKLFKTDIEMDFFIEDWLPNKEYLLKKDFYSHIPTDVNIYNDISAKWETGYLLETRIFAKRNYKKYKNKRIHFTDLRLNEYVADYLLSTIDWEKNPTINEYKEITRKNHQFIIAIYNYSTIGSSDNIPEYLLKELTRSSPETIIKIKKHIMDITEKYINLYNSFDTDVTIKTLWNEQSELNTFISDIYTILRIMKNIDKENDFKNCLLYYGEYHILHIHYLLVKLFNFELIDSKKSMSYDDVNKDGYRCIKDIIPFDTFFNKKDL